MITKWRQIAAGMCALLASLGGASAKDVPVGAALERASVMSRQASRSVLQGAAMAGQRLVAVGERGIVVLSDDAGKNWRQVQVPVSVGLTTVRFVDDKHGWIVGHGGVVLATTDGGQSWTKQFDGLQAANLLLAEAQASGDAAGRADAERMLADGADKPFLDAYFFDAKRGLVVGAYNLAFETSDGGKTWRSFSKRLDNPRMLHLYALRVRGQEIVVAGEQGIVLRSSNAGQSFQRLNVPYKGSFFTVELSPRNEIVVAGLRGNVWKSADAGASWTQLDNPMPVSITASAQDVQGRIWLGNQAGVVMSYDGSALVPATVRLPPLTGLTMLGNGQALALSFAGAVPVDLGSKK